MTIRDELLAAIEAGDHQAVHRRGWGEVWESLATANAPRQTCTIGELRPYVKFLGNEDPADVLEALEACAGEWRPVPGEVRAYLNRKHGDSVKTDAGRATDPAGTPEAIAAVAGALRDGEHICRCGCPTARKWRIDPGGVLRCAACDGLEQGQVYACEDMAAAA